MAEKNMQKLIDALNAATLPFCLCDLDFNILYVSDPAIQKFPVLKKSDGLRFILSNENSEQLLETLKTGQTVGISLFDPTFLSTKAYLSARMGNKKIAHILCLFAWDYKENSVQEGLLINNLAKKDVQSIIDEQFRSSVSDIFMVLPALSRSLEKVGDYESLDKVSHITKNCYHILSARNNLSLYNLFSSGKAKLSLSVIDYNRLFSGLVSSISSLTKQAGIPIEYVQKQNILVGEGDASKIIFMVMQLISNSLRYTREGNHISFSAEEVGKNIQIIIHDHGIGMSAEERTKAFTPFYSKDPLNYSNLRLGIGLSLVKFIVSAHNGTIMVSGKENEETIISITLPIKQTNETVQTLSSFDPTLYLTNRFSDVYVQLADFIELKSLF